MGKSINKRQKIIILFFLGIGFPSLILGYLAFRGIRNDQALLEKERKSEHRQIAQLVTNSVADSLTKTEFSFQQILNDNIRQTDILLSLKQIKLKNPLIEEVFSLDTYEQIRFPLAKLPYRLGGVKINSPDKNHSLQNLEKIKKGQQLEFQVKDYDEALRNYRLALNSTSNRQLKAELLINIARVQKKANNNRGAIKTYKAIIQDYNQLFSQNGLILPLIASFELGSLYIAGEDTIKALQTFIDAYQDIIDGKFSLDLSQYTFYRGKIKEPIDQILVLSKDSERFKNQKQSYTELERADDIKQQCCERLDIFQKNFSNELINKASLIAEDSSASWRHFDLEDGKQNYLVSALVRSINHQLWGFIINQNYFKNNIVLSSLNKVVKSDQIGWIVRSKDRQILLKSSHDDQNLNTVTVNMLNNFPPWTLEFYQAESFLLDKYLFSRRSIYLYIFLLIGIILLFGLILSIRTVTHELQLAKMKSDFVSTISHEFKSPLTSIRQISEMLRDKRVPSEQRREKYYDILVPA